MFQLCAWSCNAVLQLCWHAECGLLALRAVCRFPTFEESRESNSLVSGSGLKPTDRVLYISHRWIETAKTTATAAAASRTKQTADQSAVPIVTRPDDDLNLTYNLIRIYLSEATLPYTHIWVDCSCTDVRRMEGANGDAQVGATSCLEYMSKKPFDYSCLVGEQCLKAYS
jgi:hypothetical protein